MLYAIFDNFHELVKRTRQVLFRGGQKWPFCVFLTIEFEFLTTYEVSRPLHRRKSFIVTYIVYPRYKGAVSTSTGSSNLLPYFNSVFFNFNIELLVTKTRPYIVYSSPNKFSQYIIV